LFAVAAIPMRLTSITLTEHLQRAGKTDAPERILLFLSEQAKIESLSDSSEPVVNAPRQEQSGQFRLISY
jgi:hypothetical protein